MINKILVVDDDAMNLKLAEFILKKEGYEILKMDSGKGCLELLQSQMVDLVLLDIEMPEMSGVETLQAIREMDKFADLPVMFLSASEVGELEQYMKELNACGYVRKPFIPQELLDAVQDIIG